MGRGQRSGTADVVVEIRAVNHRFLDVKLRGVPVSPGLEEEILRKVRAFVERGAITVAIRMDRGAGEGQRIDTRVARKMYDQLRELALILKIEEPVGLSLVVAQPGVVVTAEPGDHSDGIRQGVVDALDAALETFISMRAVEGQHLAADLRTRNEKLIDLTEKIAEIATTAPEDSKVRLEERLARLLRDSATNIEESRIAQEVALLADRLDVTEELVRLRSHFVQFASMLKAEGAIGKRIGFLVQEIGREFNTVGAKSQSVEIAQLLVAAKAELEKVREQIQNIE